MPRTELRKVASSEALPLDLEALKLDLRVDSNDEDDTIERMARAAASFLERRTGRTLVPARYHAVFCEWPFDPVEIYRAPLRELEAVEYLEALNTWTAVGIENFQVLQREKSFLVSPLSTFTRPTLFTCLDSVRLVFTAGFDPVDEDSSFPNGATPLPMPPDVVTLLTMQVARWYKNRELFEAETAGDGQGAGSLFGAHRTYW